MKTFHCDKCSQQVFFENTHCGNCGSMLGYQPELQVISSFELVSDADLAASPPAGNNTSQAGKGNAVPAAPTQAGLAPAPANPANLANPAPEAAANAPADVAAPRAPALIWQSLNTANAGRRYKQCRNYAIENVCNWMLDADADSELCASCQLTRVIPSLTSDENRVYWQRLEAAKRRLLHSLWTMRIQPSPKLNDPDAGLAFEFLEDMPHGGRVLTGHADGVITINIAEADPSKREKAREEMSEPYRTLLGHFRHESGHYYFDRLIAPGKWLEPFRALFGDERQDYSESLKKHYDNGPRPDWEQHFVSSYASSHPWEDWAETWAHYLHMFDTLETAHACGVQLRPRKALEPALVITAPPLKTASFDDTLDEWFALTYVLNSLNRSVGMPDSYPFTLSPPVQDKLHFVHKVVMAQMEAAKVQGARPESNAYHLVS